MLTSPQDEVAAAKPEIDQRTEQLVSKGKWMVPGYKVCILAIKGSKRMLLIRIQEKFGDLSLL